MWILLLVRPCDKEKITLVDGLCMVIMSRFLPPLVWAKYHYLPIALITCLVSVDASESILGTTVDCTPRYSDTCSLLERSEKLLH